MKLSELSNEELDEIAAIEVMGWIYQKHIGFYSKDEKENFVLEYGEGPYEKEFTPCTDRNQSRLVVEAAMNWTSWALVIHHMGWTCSVNDDGIGLEGSWANVTPRQEVEAAILAVRAKEDN